MEKGIQAKGASNAPSSDIPRRANAPPRNIAKLTVTSHVILTMNYRYYIQLYKNCKL